ncbi:hypothetical protein GCK72_006873 [Caenorhabditis remanei]|uniref:G-protein coupled receptors family 1 profile domain-containing protein n=2 Tax=Caenorhabditis remanei TaxID=31234 RepID=E3M1U3_CAERE|nr:hypothetical protein GCK72_006873 [Caenorhabditis remanei]EFO88702.1 hypothetical protein CRE_06623 [Caenorhabditis remanei]KAF1766915.1 hypothetical protein GCK72_006873 [Caenorhabditis remanei]
MNMEATTSQLLDFEPPPIFCNSCLGSTDPEYLTYNLAVSGVLLAIVGMIGLIGNILVVKTYLHPEQAVHSTSIYLAALGFSDFFLVLTAMFLFVLEAWRHHDYPTLAYLYVIGAPIIFPVAAVFQTSSVYFCVAAAVDCFIIVVLPESVKQLYCTPKRAKMTCTILMILCCAYNVPHFFELEKVDCLDEHGLDSMQICPTDIRLDPAYYAIYYTYMYTTFLAIGPLTLLILLNICVVFTVVTKGSSNENGEDDTISLILVVFFFIFCNFTALLVNFMELIFNDPTMLVYFVDLSNLLVVVNGTANFFCYAIFGTSFRNTLKKVVLGSPAKRSAVLWINDEENKNQQSHALI